MNIDISKTGQEVRAFARQVAAIRAEIEHTKGKIQDIIFAPLCKAEIFERLEAYAIKQEKLWDDHSKSVLENIRLSHDQSKFDHELHRRPFFTEPPNHVVGVRLEAQFFGIFGAENLMTVLQEKYDSFGFDEEGLHTSKRPEKIAELERHIEKLRKKEAAMIEAAANAGLNIS